MALSRAEMAEERMPSDPGSDDGSPVVSAGESTTRGGGPMPGLNIQNWSPVNLVLCGSPGSNIPSSYFTRESEEAHWNQSKMIRSLSGIQGLVPMSSLCQFISGWNFQV